MLAVPRSCCFEHTLANLHNVLAAILQAGLRLNPRKCQLLRRETAFLGHVVSERGVATDPAKTQLPERKVAALSPQHHLQRRRRHSTPPVDPLGNGGYQATSEITSFPSRQQAYRGGCGVGCHGDLVAVSAHLCSTKWIIVSDSFPPPAGAASSSPLSPFCPSPAGPGQCDNPHSVPGSDRYPHPHTPTPSPQAWLAPSFNQWAL
ncbi:hypothetical protein AAFF_G00017870 [Aldrovandia affinis]|uniref:Uncharacterized protein n=1 Tax=Aldrovandia affinis TaxID=143900 RepID=A0AAD7S5S1_9TELE|nr:hypothetical protein AAFF_G00017870 [Aldrovandia affinis]